MQKLTFIDLIIALCNSLISLQLHVAQIYELEVVDINLARVSSAQRKMTTPSMLLWWEGRNLPRKWNILCTVPTFFINIFICFWRIRGSYLSRLPLLIGNFSYSAQNEIISEENDNYILIKKLILLSTSTIFFGYETAGNFSPSRFESNHLFLTGNCTSVLKKFTGALSASYKFKNLLCLLIPKC
jgi:hypothetical protein